jgi:TetR/AcrR family transcriptional regulator, transcriptional repressor for nem operon
MGAVTLHETAFMKDAKKSGLSKGEKTRRNIVAKAAVLFNQRGFAGCSMQDIVETVGLEKGSIYGHFSSKEELALEAFNFSWADTVQKRLGNLDTVDNAVDKLKLHVKNYVETPSFSGGCPWLNIAVDADDGNLALRERAREAIRGWEAALVGIVVDGQRRGEVRPEVHPQGVATLLISTLEGSTAISRIDKRSQALAHARQNLDLFLEAMVRLSAGRPRQASATNR